MNEKDTCGSAFMAKHAVVSLDKRWCEHIKWYEHSGIKDFWRTHDYLGSLDDSNHCQLDKHINFCPICGTPRPKEQTMLDEIVGQLAGHASMCWEPKPEGVFDSTEAGVAVMQAKSAVIDLFLSKVPAKYPYKTEYQKAGWDVHRTATIQAIEEMRK